MFIKLRAGNHFDHPLGRVRSITPNSGSEYTIQTRSGKHRPHQQYIPPVGTLKGRIVKPDYITNGTTHDWALVKRSLRFLFLPDDQLLIG